ncbi:TonB-dependent receptor [Reichenbachiella agarivorans]|uniref:TonB-dependent receptor n=1 Tax=Reichenbachiella agarivorans TaxID=2979464 RepID=A0ABY6CTB2_9BACT|nr:TonB-dependent receptor [Reichenbachiella agarivorans]UXP32623.1 TonB-dependent receptor [Reichenbachiella agarivorans]
MKRTITKSIAYTLSRGMVVLMLICLSAISVYAQGTQISGQILDETGIGLPGATIMEVGTTNGTTSDLDGKFSMKVTDQSAQITVSFIGYVSQNITVGGRSQFTVNMEVDAQSLEEVIIVGYGEQTKQTMTGAVEVVDDKAFQSQAVNNPLLSLQGQTPGLQITRASARPGNEDMNVSIRGTTSINGGSVLYVIDGVPSVETEFNNMNPDDIASVTVLKDGSAAIYGSRAANGVILVTTKKGSGAMQVQYSGSYRVKTIGNKPPVPNMSEFGTAFLAAVDAEGNGQYLQWGTRENLVDMSNGVERVYDDTAWGSIYLGDADRFDEMYGNAYSQQHNLSISGATDKTNYRVSGNFSDDQGALKTAYDGQKQYTFRMNVDQKITDRISLDVGLSHQFIKTSSPSTGLQAGSIFSDPPIFPAYNPYGQWFSNFEIGNRNSVGQTVDGGREEKENHITKINVGLTAQIVEGLEFKVLASYRQRSDMEDKYVLSVPLYTWAGVLVQDANATTYINSKFLESTRESYNAYLTYTKTIGSGHNFKLMGGVTADLDRSSNIEARRDGIESLDVYTLSLGTGVQTNKSGEGNWGLYSYIGRFNYDYQGKYLVEALGRADASSRFADGYKWQNYFSGSLGWVVSEESFLRNNSILSFLKLKASWSEMGSQAGIGENDYLSTMAFGTIPFGVDPANQTRARVSSVTTNVRTWERVQMTNLGVEFTMFKHKLSGSFDYFIKNNPNMLASQVFWSGLGGTAPTQNIGHLRTKGWEAVLGWKDQVGELRYGISVNMANNTNELVSLEGAESWVAGLNNASNDQYRVGYPLNAYWMYETDGLFQTQDEVDAYYAAYGGGGELPTGTSILRPGDIIKKDLDGNGQISATAEEGGDLKFMGDNAPHYFFGINTNLAWKGFDFTANFQGHLQQNVQRIGHLSYPFYAAWSNQTTAFLGKTWSEDNTDAEYPKLTTSSTRAQYNYRNNDFFLQNSKYIRLKTLVLGYTIPSEITNVVKISKARIYFSGNDLWEATSIKDGYDPEMGESANNVYPFMRSYALGAVITF